MIPQIRMKKYTFRRRNNMEAEPCGERLLPILMDRAKDDPRSCASLPKALNFVLKHGYTSIMFPHVLLHSFLCSCLSKNVYNKAYQLCDLFL